MKCPECGNTEEFYARPFVEWHEAKLNGSGQWIGDVECYESYLDDNVQVTCAVCSREGGWSDFEV